MERALIVEHPIAARYRARRDYAGDRWTRLALAGAILAPIAVAVVTTDQVWKWAILVTVGLAGWAVLRTPRIRIVMLASIVVGWWVFAFGWTAVTDSGPSTTIAPRPTLPPGAYQTNEDP